MIDQIVIGDKASFDDFGASVAKRARKKPKKKSIKETVPFSNITHDFTAINGEIYWEEGEHEYIFEMVAPSAERLEEMKTAFENWVMNIIKEELHDPLIPDYHFIVTYEDMSYEDDENMEKTTVSVVFSAYPYKIANHEKSFEFKVPNYMKHFYVQNDSSHRVTPRFTVSDGAELVVTNYEADWKTKIYEGTTENEAIKLASGLNTLYVENVTHADNVTLTVTFREEVF